jgi:hypothetical protein
MAELVNNFTIWLVKSQQECVANLADNETMDRISYPLTVHAQRHILSAPVASLLLIAMRRIVCNLDSARP